MTFASLVHPHVDVIPRPRLDRWGKASTACLALLGVAALGGGAFLIASPDGSAMQWTTAMLEGSPFADFLLPGIILGGLFGVGSLAVAALGLRHARSAPFLAFAIGAAMMIWIAVELAIIGEFSFLHPTMFAIGLAIAATAVPWGWPTFRAWRRR
ncbi:MAG TPA: hypothetical protein VNH13_02800 [Candidatus Acidoferrales bacterium]|nr:hypothetical protein [Candidatus Acidoferrales bacterium]